MKKENSKNTFTYTVTNKIARTIFIHYFTINVPKLLRKWSLEKHEYCINFVKKRKDSSKYDEILKLKNMGLNQTQIAKQLNVTPANINWYYKQDFFKNLEYETKQLDKMEIDIENEQ